MAEKLESYTVIGIGFVTTGILFADYSYLILRSVPFTALGLALVVLGASIVLIPQSPVPPEAVKGIMEGACANIELLLEQFDAHEKAWYLPPRDGRVYCFVPLEANVEPETVIAAMSTPIKIYPSRAHNSIPGLMMVSPGSEIVLRSKIGSETGLEEAMVYVLVDYFEGAESVKVVKEGNNISALIYKPQLRTNSPRFNNLFGSLPVCVLGCVAAHVIKTPVKVVEEKPEGKALRVNFEVLPIG